MVTNILDKQKVAGQNTQTFDGCTAISLVEMSLATALLGVLISIVGGILVLIFHENLLQKTQQQQATLQFALEKFLQRYGRLPCPSPLYLSPAQANFGLEVCSNSLDTTHLWGGIPTRTLGLTDDYSLNPVDQRPIRYGVMQSLTFSLPLLTAMEPVKISLEDKSQGKILENDLAYILLSNLKQYNVTATLAQQTQISPQGVYGFRGRIVLDNAKDTLLSGRSHQYMLDLRQRVANVTVCRAEERDFLWHGEEIVTHWPITQAKSMAVAERPPEIATNYYFPCIQRYCNGLGHWSQIFLCPDALVSQPKTLLPWVEGYLWHYDLQNPAINRDIFCTLDSTTWQCHYQHTDIIPQVDDQAIPSYVFAGGASLDLIHTQPAKTVILVIKMSPGSTMLLRDGLDLLQGWSAEIRADSLKFPQCLQPDGTVVTVEHLDLASISIMVWREEGIRIVQADTTADYTPSCGDGRTAFRPSSKLLLQNLAGQHHLYEIVGYPSSLSNVQLTEIITYLKAKWMTQLTGH